MELFYKIGLLLLFTLIIYIIVGQYSKTKEYFVSNECNSNTILDKAIQNLKSDKLKCVLDVKNVLCKSDTNNFYPLNIMKTIDNDYLAVFNNGKLYKNDDIERENLWRGPLEHSLPKDDVGLVMVTYERFGKLLGVGTDGLIYMKTNDDVGSPWNVTPLPNSGCVVYITYDKDNRMLGIDTNGNIVKKKTIEITSEWETVSNPGEFPLIKIYWDMNGHMLGVGTDFKLYQKELIDWERSQWKKKTSNAMVYDVLYDIDGRLYGITINDDFGLIELRKQNQAYYTADFYPLEDVTVQGVQMLMTSHIIQSKMGVGFVKEMEQEEKSLEDIIDPSPQELHQQYILESQNKLRELCASKKKLYNSSDFFDYELQRKIEVQDNLINKLKNELDKYSKLDKKYEQMADKLYKVSDITELIPRK
jgi:hypothetical protein